ncbi:hypothetical protein L7F22_007838 [Adiantum nelumboides]|nr:hypothetical protein [Adiantum nelumboides]
MLISYHAPQPQFTGWKDPKLTKQGEAEAKKGGEELKKFGYHGLHLGPYPCSDHAWHSAQGDRPGGPAHQEGPALNERDYGELTGLNKDDARKKWGEEQVHIWRRSFDVPPPGGESLKLTADRVLPYYEKEIKPEVLKGKKILVTAHGNSLRAMIMNLENMTGEQIVNTGAICFFFPSGGFSADHHSTTELATGVPIVYKIDESGKVVEKKILE